MSEGFVDYDCPGSPSLRGLRRKEPVTGFCTFQHTKRSMTAQSTASVIRLQRQDTKETATDISQQLVQANKVVIRSRDKVDRLGQVIDMHQAAADRNPGLVQHDQERAEATFQMALKKCMEYEKQRNLLLHRLMLLQGASGAFEDREAALGTLVEDYASRYFEQCHFEKRSREYLEEFRLREGDPPELLQQPEHSESTFSSSLAHSTARKQQSQDVRRSTAVEQRKIIEEMLTEFVHQRSKQDDDFCAQVELLMGQHPVTVASKELKGRNSERISGSGSSIDDGQPQEVEHQSESTRQDHSRNADSNVQQLKEKKAHAKEDLAEAMDDHHDLRDGYRQRLAAFKARALPTETLSTFDKKHLLELMVATGKIAEAEEAVYQAKLDLQEAKVEPSAHESSIFPDLPDDGYTDSHEADTAGKVDRDVIEQWLQDVDGTIPHYLAGNVPDDAGAHTEQEQDLLVQPKDSVSCVASGREAQHIRKRQREEVDDAGAPETPKRLRHREYVPSRASSV